MPKVTISTARKTLKSLEDRLSAELEMPFVGIAQGEKGVVSGYKSNGQFCRKSVQRVKDIRKMIRQIKLIKNRIARTDNCYYINPKGEMANACRAANARQGKEPLQNKQRLLEALVSQWGEAHQDIEQKNVEIANDALDMAFKKRITVAGKYKKLLEAHVEAHLWHVVAPKDFMRKAEKLDKEIRKTEIEVETALGEIEVKTMIDIPKV